MKDLLGIQLEWLVNPIAVGRDAFLIWTPPERPGVVVVVIHSEDMKAVLQDQVMEQFSPS